MGNDKAVIDHLLNQILNPDGLSPIELGQQRYVLTPKEEVMAAIATGTDKAFYINRTRGSRFDKTYYTTKLELLTLIAEQIAADEFTGLDLLVANEDFTWVFVTSHDGDTYQTR